MAETYQSIAPGADDATTLQAGSFGAWLARKLFGLLPKFPAKLWVLFLASFFSAPITVVFDTFANIYLADRFYGGQVEKSTVFFSHCMSAIGACLLLVPLFIYKPFLRHVGFNGSIVAGFGTVIIGLIGNGFAPDPQSFLAATAVWAFGFQLIGPVVPMLISRLSPPGATGRAFGMLNCFGNASRVIGPTALAPLYNMCHASVFFSLGASLAVVFIIVFGTALSTSDVSIRDQVVNEDGTSGDGSTSLFLQDSHPSTRSHDTYGSLPEQLQEVKQALGPIQLQLRRATSAGRADARRVVPQLQRCKSEGDMQRVIALLSAARTPAGPALV